MKRYLVGQCPRCSGRVPACELKVPEIPVFVPEVRVLLKCPNCGLEFQTPASALSEFHEASSTQPPLNEQSS